MSTMVPPQRGQRQVVADFVSLLPCVSEGCCGLPCRNCRQRGRSCFRRRKQLLPLCRQFLQGSPQQPSETHGSSETKSATTWRCPRCGGTMVLIEKLTAQQIRRRSVDRKDLVDSS